MLMQPIENGAITMRWKNSRLAACCMAAILLLCFIVLLPPAHAARGTSPEWSVHHINHWITFSYPTSFVSVNDGSPDMILAGGALLSANHASYEILMGVAVDTNRQHSVNSVAQQLITSYKIASLLQDAPSAYGRHLVFMLPGHDTYSVYLTRFAHGIREIIINNEHSKRTYEPWILRFVKSVHDES